MHTIYKNRYNDMSVRILIWAISRKFNGMIVFDRLKLSFELVFAYFYAYYFFFQCRYTLHDAATLNLCVRLV